MRKLAHSVQARGDWIVHGRMVARSWDGHRTRGIATALHCPPQTVRDRLQAFNVPGLEGRGMRPGGGRKPRLSEAERSALIALARTPPPGQRMPAPASGKLQARDETKEPEWTLDRLTAAARAQGIQVARSQQQPAAASSSQQQPAAASSSQLRGILLADGVRWRRTRLGATSHAADVAPTGRRSSPAPPTRRRGRRSSVSMNSGR